MEDGLGTADLLATPTLSHVAPCETGFSLSPWHAFEPLQDINN